MPRKGRERSGVRTLLRLWPWFRPRGRGVAVMVVGDVVALAAQTVAPLVIARMIDGPIAHGDRAGLWRGAGLLLVLALVQTAAYAARRWPTPGGIDVAATLRRDVYAHAQRLPALHHERGGSGSLVARLVGDAEQIADFYIIALVWFVSNLVTLTITSAMLVGIHPWLGLIVLVALMPLGFTSTLFATRFRGVAREGGERAGALTTAAEESALAIRVLKALGGGAFATNRFVRAADGVRTAELNKVRLTSMYVAALVAYPLVVLTVVVVGGGVAVANGAITIGAFVAFTTFYFRVLFPVMAMGQLVSDVQEAASATERILDVLDTAPTLTDPARPIPLPARGPLSVRFEGVHFCYPDADAPVLDGIDLDIRAGETLALVGATASGKTTLTGLVNRLADVTRGRVLVGGVDVRELALDDLRGAVGTAFEDPTLFATDVRENLTMGRAGIDDSEIDNALATTSAGFVAELPEGLDTVIGEQGHTLSGGQRQRIALARALLDAPRVLVLDDPMSALDVRTEETVERALCRRSAGVTTLIVARRPSTALLADRVAVLDGGRIVDVGTHEELLCRSAIYRNLLVSAPVAPVGAAGR